MGFRFLGGTGLDGLAPTDWHIHFDDFDNYTAADWVISETGSGTRDISDAKDGVLLITNAAADNDLNSLQWSGATDSAVAETWAFVSGKPLYIASRLKISDATESFLVFGLVVTDTDTEGGITNGIYFRKDDGDANLDCIVMGSSVSTGSITAASTVTADTWMVLEAYYDGVTSAIQFFKDGVGIGSVPLTNVPTTELAVTFTIKNGTDAAKALSIDWFKIGQMRGS